MPGVPKLYGSRILPRMEPTPDHHRLYQIFMPFAYQKHIDAAANNTRFVHYTSADIALKIIKSGEIWMRNASCMDDYSEVQHGLNCLRQASSSSGGTAFKNAVNRVADGLMEEVELLFNSWTPDLQLHTYVTCLSEHRQSEDDHGRLSMWRAYGGITGVAIVVNNKAFLSESNALNAFTSPVAYLNTPQVEEELAAIAQEVESNRKFLNGVGRETIKSHIFNMLKFGTLCTKHRGFHEELEWRVIHTPTSNPSNRLRKDIESIDGIPQTVYKIPLKNVPEEGFTGAEIDELIERVIIGPTQYPAALGEAFMEELTNAGVKNASDRISISGIPIR